MILDHSAATSGSTRLNGRKVNHQTGFKSANISSSSKDDVLSQQTVQLKQAEGWLRVTECGNWHRDMPNLRNL